MVKRTTSFSKMFLVDNIRLSTYNDCCECNQDTHLHSVTIPNSIKYSTNNDNEYLSNNVDKITTATTLTENKSLPIVTYTENFPSVTENTSSPPVTTQNNSLYQTLPQTQRDTEPMSQDASQSHVETSIETVNNQEQAHHKDSRNLVPSSAKDIVPSRTGPIVSTRSRSRLNPHNNIRRTALTSPENVQQLKGLTQQQQALLPTIQYANTVSNQSGGQNQRRNHLQRENQRRHRQQFALPYPPTNKDRSIARKSSNRSENFSQIQQPALEMDTNNEQPTLNMETNYQQPALETNYQQPALDMHPKLMLNAAEAPKALTYSSSTKRKKSTNSK